MKGYDNIINTPRPIPFGRADAEKMGLKVGKRIIYEVFSRKTTEVKEERLSKRKTGTVWAIWKHGFVVEWDSGWKECFPFQYLKEFRSSVLTREKIRIRK